MKLKKLFLLVPLFFLSGCNQSGIHEEIIYEGPGFVYYEDDYGYYEGEGHHHDHHGEDGHHHDEGHEHGGGHHGH